MLIIRLRLLQAPLLALVFCGALQAQTDNNGAVNARDGAVKIERQQQGIQAELVDAGDYYFRPDGTKARFYRKKDVFVVNAEPDKRARAMQRMKARFGDRVKEVTRHRLGIANVVRLDNRLVTKARQGQSFELKPEMLASLDSAVDSMMPVFANSRGQGDLILLSKITIKVSNDVDVSSLLTMLQTKYGLFVEEKLRLTGNIYSLKYSTTNAGTERFFSNVRSITKEPGIIWAEPQFFSKPYKTSFVAADNPLYDRQWHLRNTGIGGSRCDTDCDASNAWDIDVVNNTTTGGGGDGAVAGAGTVIAIIDDGVDLNHQDLRIWTNPTASVEMNGTAGVDDDNNGCVDDIHGCDFVVDDASAPGSCGDDGEPGQDGDPSPQPTTLCVDPNGDDIEQDNHGTAVAGIAAAIGDDDDSSDVGVLGTAFRAEILPIRLISAFDLSSSSSFCNTAAQAIEYAGRYADVISNSWQTDDMNCQTLRDAIKAVSEGTQMDGMTSISKRPDKGSPVIFASGNNASGWIKVTVPVTAGEHAYEWRFLRDGSSSLIDDFNIQETVWLDDITWPDGTVLGFENFSTDILQFENDCVVNECNTFCEEGDQICSTFEEENTNLERVRVGGNSSAKLDMNGTDCANSYLHTIKDGPSGEISFWIWVSTITGLGELEDQFEFLVDGKEQLSFGDIPAFGFVDDNIGFPAFLSGEINNNDPDDPAFPGVIAVGSSTSGDLSEQDSTTDLEREEKASYSQYGDELDVVAPGSDQHLGITTTDRSGADGYNDTRDIGGSALPDPDYTDDFEGTSASTAIVAGVAAAMIAVDPTLTAADIKRKIRQTADKIGRSSYASDGLTETDGTRNDFVGYGRVNMYKALLSADPDLSVSEPPTDSCQPETYSYSVSTDLILSDYTPVLGQSCPAIGPLPELDDLCLPIRTSNDRIAVICI